MLGQGNAQLQQAEVRVDVEELRERSGVPIEASELVTAFTDSADGAERAAAAGT